MSQYDLEKIEELVRKGKFTDVKVLLGGLNYSQAPRADLHQLANIAYRIHNPRLSLRILGPIIRQTHISQVAANDKELAEYAIALCRLGATKEARYWLQQAENQKLPKVLLYHSFIAITEWNYSQAIPYLTEYIQSSDISDYQKLVAKTNLAASYIFVENWNYASPLLKELRQLTQSNNHQLLHANALELSSQLCFLTGNKLKATQLIEDGLKLSQTSSASFFLRKWKAIIAYTNNPSDETAILKVLNEARHSGAWESIRECYFYLAKKRNDVQLFLDIYFSTPNLYYREKLRNNFGLPVVIPECHTVFLNGNPRGTDVIHLSEGLYNDQLLIKPGSLTHKTLQVVSQDLYKPIRLGSLFSFLYPDEHYNPHSTPDRVHQLIKRLRKILLPTPLEIRESGGMYSIYSETDIGLLIRKKAELKESMSIKEQKLKDHCCTTSFSIKDVMALFNVSRTQAHYIIKSTEKNNGLIKSGKGPSTKYHFKTKQSA